MKPFTQAAAAAILSSAMISVSARPLVVELYTSQGCSSCPPADAYVGKLSTRSDVIALAFHVTYWDDLGWRDRFGFPQAVERQNIYARNLHRTSVYTPQIVIEGRNDGIGSSSGSVEQALRQAREEVSIALAVSDHDLSVEVGSAAHASPSDVILVTYLRHASTKIGRGENSGRTLEEFNIVRDFRTLGQWNGSVQQFHIPLASIPKDATDVAVLLQAQGQAQILGAAARSLGL